MDEVKWNCNPARKYFERILLLDKKHPLRISTHPYGRMSQRARKQLIWGTYSLPSCMLVDMMIDIRKYMDPPEELRIQQTKFFDGRELHLDRTMMRDKAFTEKVFPLALLGLSTPKIYSIISRSPMPFSYTLEQVEKFLYHYWNTNPLHGWNANMKEAFESYATCAWEAPKELKHIVKIGSGEMPLEEVYMNLNLNLDEDTRVELLGAQIDSLILKMDHALRNNDHVVYKDLALSLGRITKSKKELEHQGAPDMYALKSQKTIQMSNVSKYSIGSG